MNETLKEITIPAQASFEDAYAELRAREGRVYSNEELLRLPEVPDHHPLAGEWKLRRQSTNRLLKKIAKKNRSVSILEVGCGNGWLSNRLASLPNTLVTGIDIHTGEVLQASATFYFRANLEFLAGDFRVTQFPRRFDFLVFAASLQYFPFVDEIIERSMQLLNKNGELHILDTHFYNEKESLEAATRSAAYFEQMGVPEMTLHYHHHRWSDLEGYPYELLHAPGRIGRWLGLKQNPFPWIRIIK